MGVCMSYLDAYGGGGLPCRQLVKRTVQIEIAGARYRMSSDAGRNITSNASPTS